MKAVQQEIAVTMRGEGCPHVLYWQGRTYVVSVLLDQWRFGGRWWLDERPRDCYLIQAGSLVAELHHEDSPGGRWWLARLQD